MSTRTVPHGTIDLVRSLNDFHKGCYWGLGNVEFPAFCRERDSDYARGFRVGIEATRLTRARDHISLDQTIEAAS